MSAFELHESAVLDVAHIGDIRDVRWLRRSDARDGSRGDLR